MLRPDTPTKHACALHGPLPSRRGLDDDEDEAPMLLPELTSRDGRELRRRPEIDEDHLR